MQGEISRFGDDSRLRVRHDLRFGKLAKPLL
jgi:hypothetical protein